MTYDGPLRLSRHIALHKLILRVSIPRVISDNYFLLATTIRTSGCRPLGITDSLLSRERGGLKTNRQVRLLMSLLRNGLPLQTAAAKAGMSEPTARKYRTCGPPRILARGLGPEAWALT